MKLPKPLTVILPVCIIFVAVALTIFVKSYDKYGINLTIPFCIERYSYSNSGFGDSTDYKEYHYTENGIKKFKQGRFFKKVKTEDTEKIRGYFDDYKSWVEMCDFYDKYTFDTECIKDGDFYYIYSLEGEPIGDSAYGKYDNYDVYYVDVEKRIMYFIHSNI